MADVLDLHSGHTAHARYCTTPSSTSCNLRQLLALPYTCCFSPAYLLIINVLTNVFVWIWETGRNSTDLPLGSPGTNPYFPSARANPQYSRFTCSCLTPSGFSRTSSDSWMAAPSKSSLSAEPISCRMVGARSVCEVTCSVVIPFGTLGPRTISGTLTSSS